LGNEAVAFDVGSTLDMEKSATARVSAANEMTSAVIERR
jgi:hypothetical protein